MKSAKSFLSSIDQFQIDIIVEQKNAEIKSLLTESDETIAKGVAVLSTEMSTYKQHQLMEYLDKNKDKLLSLQKYTEGDPVVISQDYEPLAHRKGKVISQGAAAGTYKISFDDGEYDVPEHHISRDDAIANESTEEYRCLALTEDGILVPIILESQTVDLDLISTTLNERVILVLPESVSNSFVVGVNESTMTDDQKKKREEIVLALKKNKDDLKHRYGSRWENVMYAIATKQAMEENFVFEAADEVIFSHKNGDELVEIVKSGEYFTVRRKDPAGTLINAQTVGNIKEAEQIARELI